MLGPLFTELRAAALINTTAHFYVKDTSTALSTFFSHAVIQIFQQVFPKVHN